MENKNKNMIESIRARRVKLSSEVYTDTHKRIRELRKEIVKVSFQKQPNLELHRYLMKQLQEANEELIRHAS